MPGSRIDQSPNDDSFVHNRIRDVLIHTKWYAFKGEARLAHDARMSKAGLSRIINGQSAPSFRAICKIVAALEKELGLPVDPREVVSFTGTYPTPSVCDLVGCRGCLPDAAYLENDERRPGFTDDQKGRWSVAPSDLATQPVSNEEAT